MLSALIILVSLSSCSQGVTGLTGTVSSSNVNGSTWIGAQLDLTILPSTAVTARGGCTAQVPFYGSDTLWNYTSFVARFNRTYDDCSIPFVGEAIAAMCTSNCPGQAPCVCPNVVPGGYYIYTGPSTALKAYDPFDLLVQPGPSANFNYSWTSFADVLTNNQANGMVMSIDGSVPCCIPVNLTGQPPSAWSKATGRRLGLCNLSTNISTYSLGWDVFSVNLTNLIWAGRVQALVKLPTPGPAAGAPTAATRDAVNVSTSLSTLHPAMFPAVGNLSKAMVTRSQELGSDIADPGWQAFRFPGGCQTSVKAGDTTSAVQFQNLSNYVGTPVPPYGELNGSGVPSWYVPSTKPGVPSEWFIAALNVNQTTGPSHDNDWTWGRAFVDHNSTWQAFFPKAGIEWEVSRLVAPATFQILGGKVRSGGSDFLYHESSNFRLAAASAISLPEHGTFFVNISGAFNPCCIDKAVVPQGSPASTNVTLGSVLGVCNLLSKRAEITWLGSVYQQDIANARLLTMTISSMPDAALFVKTFFIYLAIALACLALLGWLLTALYAGWSYRRRAKQSLVQDEVYNLVLGIRNNPSSSDDVYMTTDPIRPAPLGIINIDRFYNLLPFINRMPRNLLYATLSSNLAGFCFAHWMRAKSKGEPEADDLNSLFASKLRGYAGTALAYSIMKHETCWASHEQSIADLWRTGHKGRLRLAASLAKTIKSPELQCFLDGMDPIVEEPENMTSKGYLMALSRLLFLTLPNHRASQKEAAEAALSDVAANLDPSAEDSLESLVRLTSMPSERPAAVLLAPHSTGASSAAKAGNSSSVTGSTSGTSKQRRSASGSLPMPRSDDWAIKPSEIEIMTKSDGSPVLLGRGAFGEVFKAKYNSVQVVAVKQLREGGDEKAKLNFLREVAILKKLRAENVVRFLGVCERKSKLMLVTEYMAGGDLYNRLLDEADQPSSELAWHNQGRRIAVDIARGLAFLHSQQIAHFDLKSPNILLARDNTAKIADVGVARFLSADYLSQASILGTRCWMAPEIGRGSTGCFSTKADIFSFGIVLWEIVTGQSPRWGCNWWRTPKVPQECPAHVADLIERCTVEDPSGRPTSKEIYQLLLADTVTSGTL